MVDGDSCTARAEPAQFASSPNTRRNVAAPQSHYLWVRRTRVGSIGSPVRREYRVAIATTRKTVSRESCEGAGTTGLRGYQARVLRGLSILDAHSSIAAGGHRARGRGGDAGRRGCGVTNRECSRQRSALTRMRCLDHERSSRGSRLSDDRQQTIGGGAFEGVARARVAFDRGRQVRYSARFPRCWPSASVERFVA